MTRQDKTRQDASYTTLRSATLHYAQLRYTTLSYATPKLRHAKLRYVKPITTARRHPDQALPSNHNGTAPPAPGSPQKSQRHSAAQTRLSPPITTARRHPDQALPSNHNGTAPQSFAQATPLKANPKGTAHRAQNERARSLAVARGRSRTLAATIPKSERTRSRPQTPQTKTRTLRYAFGKKAASRSISVTWLHLLALLSQLRRRGRLHHLGDRDVRLHGSDTGPLDVAPKSHALGDVEASS